MPFNGLTTDRKAVIDQRLIVNKIQDQRVANMSMHYLPDIGTISSTPNYPADSPFALLQSFLFDTEEVQYCPAFPLAKLKLQGSPVSPLSPWELAAGSNSARPRRLFHNQGSYQITTTCESSPELRTRFYSKAPNRVVNLVNDSVFSEMSIDSPSSFVSSSVQILPAPCSGMQFQNSTDNHRNQQVVENISGFDASSKRQSIARTLREIEDALLGPDDEEKADLASTIYTGSDISSNLDMTDQLIELIPSISTFVEPELPQAPKEAKTITNSSSLCELQDNSIFLALPPKRPSDSFSEQLAPPKIKEASPQDLFETTNNPEQLLVFCARAISENDLEFSQKVMAKLNQVVSIYGDPMERLAAYMVEGLAARLQSTGKGIYKSLKCKETPNLELLSAMQVMFEACPYFKFSHMAANGSILEAFKDQNRVHIVDFEIGHGTQWFSLIQALGARPTGPPHLRITGIGDPDAEFAPAGGLRLVGERLAKLAESVNMTFEFHARPMKLQDLQASTVDRRPDEAFAVNAAMQLHHMPDESVCTSNHRDRILRLVKSWNPNVLALVEQENNSNTSPFFPRFLEALSYYSAIFESLDVTLPRESRDRVNVEQKCLAREIVNIIACEGLDRVERHEVTGKWRARMAMAGLQPSYLSSVVNNTIKTLLESYCPKYTLQEEAGALHLGWSSRRLVVASAWH